MRVITLKLMLSEEAYSKITEIGYTDEMIIDEAKWIVKGHLEEVVDEIYNGIGGLLKEEDRVRDKNVKIL